MAHELVNFIREHGIDELEKRFAIKHKRHGVYNNLILLKYNQINSPTSHPIVRECRGIILDEADDWKVVCYTYRRFANYGESWADDVDWENARCYEKVDGSLMQLYHYNNKWQVATSGMPDASGEVLGSDITFADLFWKVWNDLGYKLPQDIDMCYAFELMTPYNRIVVKHSKNNIVLHSARRLSDFKEINPIVVAHQNGWECVKIHPLQNIEDVKLAIDGMDGLKSEGFVICDDNFNRVKIKCKSYVNLSHMKESCVRDRRILDIIRNNESHEFLTYFPEMEFDFKKIEVAYNHLIKEMSTFYSTVEHIDNRKDFASLVISKQYSGILFGVKYGKFNSIEHGLSKVNIKVLEKWLGAL